MAEALPGGGVLLEFAHPIPDDQLGRLHAARAQAEAIKAKITVKYLQKAAGVSTQRAGDYLRAIRAALGKGMTIVPAAAPSKAGRPKKETPPELMEALGEVQTLEDIARVLNLMAQLEAEDKLTGARADAIRKNLSAKRAVLKDLRAARKDSPEEDPEGEKALLCSPEAFALVRVYEGIVSPQRRAAVIRFLREQAEEDIAETPTVDTTARAK